MMLWMLLTSQMERLSSKIDMTRTCDERCKRSGSGSEYSLTMAMFAKVHSSWARGAD